MLGCKSLFLFLCIAARGLAQLGYSLPEVYSSSGELHSGAISLDKVSGGENYSLLFSVDPSALGATARVKVSLVDGDRVLLSKTLHAGDADLYGFFRPVRVPQLDITAEGVPAKAQFQLQVNKKALNGGPNRSWEDAASMTLGDLVIGSGDEASYVPLPGTSKNDIVEAAANEHWYRFRWNEDRPRLVYFQLELMDRDGLPADVAVFKQVQGKIVEFNDSRDPVTLPHEVQALPGNAFTVRVFQDPGTYFVRVRASHPEFKLRTRVYELPPYDDPSLAVRTAVDYIMGAGDSWFVNTPRRGGTYDRVNPVHQETSLCVACHASHFSQRAQMYAIANGYPVWQRAQLHFLQERFANNPRPFYGFEEPGAVWSRVISASGNVLSRMSVLGTMYEQLVSGIARPAWHQGIAEYLKLYYSGRTKLPPDETNGNTPLVSAHEVAWYSWKVTKDPRLPEMIAQGDVKNMIDLCYQTLALAEIDKAKYAAQIKANADRILKEQREDGQWAMPFDPKQPEVEFQTGHALWALAAAGVTKDNPQVQKAVHYLLQRQQPWGGWLDPLQSYENFRTPFRETQFAILALSSLYPGPGHTKGWDLPVRRGLDADPARLVKELDDVWDCPPADVVKVIESVTGSNEVLVRQTAAQTLGRLALPESVPVLVKLLGDPSKLVQRAAAWSLRQVYLAHPETSDAELLAAMGSKDARVRWGATRVFAHQFAVLAKHKEIVAALEKLTGDPVIAVRMQAVQGLWQAWFWNADPAVRGEIEDTVIAALGQPQHEWIESNLHAALYNLADENIRYLYNNWVALLGRPEDRVRAIQGRLGVEAQLAAKIAKVLQQGPDTQKKAVLQALVEFPLRRGDVYDLAGAVKNLPLVYNRIGNDTEQVEFFGSSAALIAKALLPLVSSADGDMRELARRASLMVREVPFEDVEKAAGGRSETVLELSRNLDANAPDVAKAFHAPPPRARSGVPAPPIPLSQPLNKDVFESKIEPILTKKGSDGYACVNCHETHTLFNATWDTVRNVVDRRDPENSLLLRKPTSTAESEGVVGAKALSHGGGQRWPKDSAEYETILKWIEGK
jgi:HEAT repeats/Squalene-hopene cyclase C-terminal domain